VVLVAGAIVVAAAPRATATPGPRSSATLLPVGPAPTRAPGNLGGAPCLPVVGCDPLGGLGADAAKSMANAVFDAFGTFVADGVRTTLDQVSLAITKTTAVKLDRDWFQQHAAVMRSLAVLVLLPMMLVGLMSAVIHRDAGQLLRAGLVYVPVAIIGGVVAIELTERALQVTDWATGFVTGDLNTSTENALGALKDAVATISSHGAPGLATFLADVVLLVLMAGALLIWIELLLRTGAIYVVVLFLPVALSGLVWRGTVNWTRRMIEILVALILSKFVIVVVIDLAAGMITAGDGIGTIMQGATLLLLAACAPFALLRLVPIMEAGLIGQLERMERRPLAAATRATTAVVSHLAVGVDLAGASNATSANGGNALAALRQNQEPGGQLNDIAIPDDWTIDGARARPGPGPVGPVDGGGPGPAGPTQGGGSGPAGPTQGGGAGPGGPPTEVAAGAPLEGAEPPGGGAPPVVAGPAPGGAPLVAPGLARDGGPPVVAGAAPGGRPVAGAGRTPAPPLPAPSEERVPEGTGAH
jgi:hypothetical protein